MENCICANTDCKMGKIPNFKQCKVTTCGQVYSVKLKRFRKLQVRNGHHVFGIVNRKTNYERTFKLDKLVIQTFNPHDDHIHRPIIHIDGNTLNNNLNNLKWGTKCNLQKNEPQEMTCNCKKCEFVKINGYSNYLISKCGTIYSLSRHIIKSQYINMCGYYSTSLSVNNKSKTCSVHKLVAQTFIDNPNNYKIVNHKDGNKLNNHTTNLEWCTYKQNTQHAYELDLIEHKKISPILPIPESKWKIIDDFDNYSVSNKGQVKNIQTEKILTPIMNSGYYTVHLYGSNINKRLRIHRLVAINFINNPNNYKIVNHKDGNKLNNCIENLEWCTHKQNIQHAHDTHLIRTKKAVIQLSLDGKTLNRFDSIREASRQTGVNHRCISYVCNKKMFTSGGFKWKYDI